MRAVTRIEGVNGCDQPVGRHPPIAVRPQAASDLEENRRLQQELTERITVLKQEEALLADLLGKYDEPRLAKELRDELLVKHPDRNPTPQVVRNTLESLVAKGRIRHHKQERSVMYTLVKPG